MKSTSWMMCLLASLAIVAISGLGLPVATRGDDAKSREIPADFSPLEYLVGEWKGQATPKDTAQSFRGWPEAHAWAWIFSKGKPTGLSVSITGGKVLAEGKLTFKADQRRYRLEGTQPKPNGSPIAFEGSLDASGKSLVLNQVVRPGEDQPQSTIRLSIRPNANMIRYTFKVDRKSPTDARFRPSYEIGMGKEGESLAGTVASLERPKCIVTGGAATMTVSYQGRTFQICCTGCRDEFNENPEKYIKKASLMAQTESAKPKPAASSSRISRSDDAFASDVSDAPAMKRKTATAESRSKTAKSEDTSDPDGDPIASADSNKSASGKASGKTVPAPSATRAAGLLQVGQNLEKSGKTSTALGYYKRIVKEFPETPAAKTAKQRIKSIENP